MTAKRVIFAGQSGMRIRETLKDFITKCSPFVRGKQPPVFLQLEDEMKEVYLRSKKRQDPGNLLMSEILTLPIPALYELWNKAFESILKKVEANESQDIFLNLHACFYHHYTVQYLSLIKLQLLEQFSPQLFVTLIDDIYDVHTRLRDRDQIFHLSNAGRRDPIGAIMELLRVLDWRSKEIMMVRHLANQFNVPHCIFAVKHSYDTLFRLLYEDKPKFYVSHPIREVKRLQKDGETEKAAEVINAIHRLEIKSSSEFVSFLPTTIDELRIDKDSSGSFIPGLTARWDTEKYMHPVDMLFLAPKHVRNESLWDQDSAKTSDVSLLLGVLADQIERQISSRDHKLVEQSDYLLVYRPCFNGNPSAGVMKEVQYYSKLKPTVQHKCCFIYFPRKDLNELKIKQLQKTLDSKAKSGELSFDEPFVLSSDEASRLIKAESDPAAIIKVLEEIMDARSIGYAFQERHGLESDPTQRALCFKRGLAREYISVLERTIGEYNKAATVLWDDDDLSPELLIDKVIERLGKDKPEES